MWKCVFNPEPCQEVVSQPVVRKRRFVRVADEIVQAVSVLQWNCFIS